MKPSTELFTIIKSLTKSEKRFFKLSSSLQSGEKNYLKIFDYIDGQSSYNENDLKEYFSGKTFVKHLPSEKNHLYKLILKSLRSFHSSNSINSRLNQQIKNIEILYNKALYKECDKFVSRAKSLAQKYEKFYFWFDLISWEKLLIETAFESGEFNKDLDELIKEEELVIAKLRNLAEYTMIYSKINLVFRTGGFTRNEAERKIVEDISNYHLIKGKNTAISDNAASICYYIKGLCAATNRDFAQSYEFFNKTKQILDNNPNVKSEEMVRYVMTNFFLIRCYIDSESFDEAQALLDEVKVIEGMKGQSSVDLSVRVFANSYYYQSVLYQRRGEFQSSVNLIGEIESKEKLYKDKLSKEMEIQLAYTKSYGYFGVGNYKQALNYLNIILNDNEQNLRQDIYTFARIYNLVLHFELGNFNFMDYIVKSTNRYLSKQKKDYQMEGVIVKYVRKLAKTEIGADRIELFQKMQSDVLPMLEDHNERVVLEYFDVKAWMKSKINKISFAEVLKG